MPVAEGVLVAVLVGVKDDVEVLAAVGVQVLVAEGVPVAVEVGVAV